jgi:hypothetical protein
MPGQEDAAVSRRSVLKGAAGAAGAGAAGIAVTALSGGPAAAAETAKTSPRASADLRGPAEAEAADETIVVHVRDAAAGEIDIYRGTTQTRLLDRELAARLVRASR